MTLIIAPLRSTDGDFKTAVRLLEGADLPVDDIHAPQVRLWAARQDDTLAGLAGFERAGQAGLLRSLAVVDGFQGRGLAGTLCQHVFAHAKSQGLTEIYLLTTTAADYFPRLGFTRIARDDAPDNLRATAQFSSLCPADAALMRKGF